MEFITDYFTYWQERYDTILEYLWEHMLLSFTAIILAILITIPLAIYMTKMKNDKIRDFIFQIANILQTIPTIAMLAIMIPILGIGFKPAVAALFLYAILPLIRNTYSGIKSIDPGIIEAAKGMGLNSVQRTFRVELPVALPYIMSGIRTTSVYIISWTTLAAVVGAGGLGDLVIGGIGYNDQNMIFTGTILAIGFALLLDFLFAAFDKKYTTRVKGATK